MALAASVLLPPPASSQAQARATLLTDYEMPFPCGQVWTGTTRRSHSPSSKAIDWNRSYDVGDAVVASAPGVITTADKVDNSGYGRWIVIDHGNGEDSLYAHLSSVDVVVGQRVDQGMRIGTVGSTGNSTGAHLHFEERKSRTVVQPFLHGTQFVFGTSPRSRNCVDVPLAADWFGYGRAQLTIFRRATPAQFRILRTNKDPLVKRFGTATDEPVPGNWDGLKGANPGVFTPASATFTLKTPAGRQSIVLGNAASKPIAGDWNGDGKDEVGVWNARRARFVLRAANGTLTRITLGNRDDLPVVGDWDGDGAFDVGVFDSATATFTLRKVDEEGTVWLGTIQFGRPGDLPVAGDWDRNGRTDLGVWTPATAVFTQRFAASATTAKARSLNTVRFGRRR